MDKALSLFFELFWWWFESLLLLNSPASFCVAWLLLLYVLWERFVIVMGLYRAHLQKRLYGLNKVLGVPSVVIGVVLDAVTNWTVAILVFRDWPREWLVTTRCKRYLNDEQHREKWRGRRALWWCTHVFDPLDPTAGHCD